MDVSNKVAHLAKKFGFDSDQCRKIISPTGDIVKLTRTNKWLIEHGKHWGYDGYSILPTQEQLRKWLREKHRVDISNTHKYDGTLTTIYIFKYSSADSTVSYQDTNYENSLEQVLEHILSDK